MQCFYGDVYSPLYTVEITSWQRKANIWYSGGEMEVNMLMIYKCNNTSMYTCLTREKWIHQRILWKLMTEIMTLGPQRHEGEAALPYTGNMWINSWGIWFLFYMLMCTMRTGLPHMYVEAMSYILSYFIYIYILDRNHAVTTNDE